MEGRGGGVKGCLCKVLLGFVDWVGKIFVKRVEKIMLITVMRF